MTWIETFLPEFDREMATTRGLLERVPEAKTGWRPHPKSWTLGELSLHLSHIPSWVAMTLERGEMDLAPPGGAALPRPKFESAAATLGFFDKNVRDARASLAVATDEQLRGTWTLKQAGKPLFTLPRTHVVRTTILSHMIHHRGQLSLYLRLCDVPLPKVYGPTADATEWWSKESP